MNSKKLLTLFILVRAYQFFITYTFIKSIYSFLLTLIINLRYLVVLTLNLYFFKLIYSLTSTSYIKTLPIYLLYSFKDLLVQIKILSRYIIQKLSRQFLKAQFIQYQNVLSVFTNLKRVINYLNRLNYILKAIFYSYPTFIFIL